MTRILIVLALAGCATPALAQAGLPPAVTVEVPVKNSKAQPKGSDVDMAQVVKMFDKIFPAQPDPLPARLALARATANGVLPNGTYAAMFGEAMSGVVDRVLGISAADLGIKPGKNAPPSSATLREQIAKDDPHFDERMRITRRLLAEELIKISAIIEPRLREGLARSIARRFDEQQLGEINAFLATESGRAFGGQTMRMWVDPDVMRSMMQSFPDLIAATPSAMKRLEVETAHLPKPSKAEAKSTKKARK